MTSEWFNNFNIYYENLSGTYVFCIMISFIAVFITWLYGQSSVWNRSQQDKRSSSNQTLQNESGTSDDEGVGESGILTQLKIARQEAIVQQLSAGMTEEQLEEEKEMEKQQLEAILQLLRQQEEKFQVGSMEELQDQLRLYRK